MMGTAVKRNVQPFSIIWIASPSRADFSKSGSRCWASGSVTVVINSHSRLVSQLPSRLSPFWIGISRSHAVRVFAAVVPIGSSGRMQASETSFAN